MIFLETEYKHQIILLSQNNICITVIYRENAVLLALIY